uniref:Uncharacterized protein n=1 Tax=Anguilla anguilla TaxID=7936 RepID=A0A0E9UVB8_ANGAN
MTMMKCSRSRRQFMEFWMPLITPLSDSITFSWISWVTVKSKDQRPTLAAMTPANRRLTER